MPAPGHFDSQPIPPTEFIRLTNSEDWLVDKGVWTDLASLHGARATSDLRKGGGNEIVLNIAGSASAANILIKSTDRIIYGAYPYLVQVWRVTDRLSPRKQDEGGGMHLVPQHTLMISFRNDALKRKEDEERRRLRIRDDLPVMRIASRPAPQPKRFPDLDIVSGPTREELVRAIGELAMWPIPAERPKLRFEMANGKVYEGSLIGFESGMSHGGSLYLTIQGMSDNISYCPESGTGSMFEEF